MSVRKHYSHEAVLGLKVGRLNKGLNTQFIVYTIGDTVIDSGPSNQWRHVSSFLQQQAVSQLLLTHHHEDHAGNAHSIGKQFGITPKAPALSYDKLSKGYPTPLLQKIVWGSLKKVQTTALQEREYLSDGSDIIPVHTPGHAKDLTCFHLPKQGYFFSGDLFIANKLKLMRSDENLTQLINSIQKVLALDFDVLFCPHGGIIKQGKQALQQKLDYILAMCEKVQQLSAKGLDEQSVCDEILGPKDFLGKLTGGNMSKLNLIHQCGKVML
jgi:glyoxylase-like metal-dependent hydrolase (beta-lactamase superfamily II)